MTSFADIVCGMLTFVSTYILHKFQKECSCIYCKMQNLRIFCPEFAKNIVVNCLGTSIFFFSLCIIWMWSKKLKNFRSLCTKMLIFKLHKSVCYG